MKRTILTVALGCALLLSGCGGGEEDTTRESISASLMKQQSKDEMISLEKDQADCIAEDMVDGIGVEQLKEYGFLKKDGKVNEDLENLQMSTKDAETMADAMFDCTEAMDAMKKQLSALSGQSPEMKKCFEDALTEETVRGLLVATFSGKTDAESQKVLAPLLACTPQGAVEPPKN